MHLERSAYGRTWECDRGRDLRSRCAGLIRVEDREPLTDLQLATAMARRSFGGSKERAKDQARYRRLVTSLRELEASPYLSSPEREGLAEARGTVERLAKAAALAKDRVKRQEKAAEAEREARYRERRPDSWRCPIPSIRTAWRPPSSTCWRWIATPTRTGSFSPSRSRASRTGCAGVPPPSRAPWTSCCASWRPHQEQVRAHVARDWASSAEPLADLSARLAEGLPALREAILAAPPMLLLGVRHVLDGGVPLKVFAPARSARRHDADPQCHAGGK
jgi:hypothetical protein